MNRRNMDRKDINDLIDLIMGGGPVSKAQQKYVAVDADLPGVTLNEIRQAESHNLPQDNLALIKLQRLAEINEEMVRKALEYSTSYGFDPNSQEAIEKWNSTKDSPNAGNFTILTIPNVTVSLCMCGNCADIKLAEAIFAYNREAYDFAKKQAEVAEEAEKDDETRMASAQAMIDVTASILSASGEVHPFDESRKLGFIELAKEQGASDEGAEKSWQLGRKLSGFSD